MAKLNFGAIPNSNINQTIGKVTCPSVGALLECAREELATVERICMLLIQQAANMRGNMQSKVLDLDRYGVDAGVETLCLALNLWP
jgi:hypothetical protein